MSLGLTKPGIRSANLAGKIHPRTGLALEPIGFLKDGTAVWPQMGAAPDAEDPDDPTFTGEDDDSDEDEDDDEEEDDKPKGKGKKKSKSKKDEDEDDDDDEDEEDRKPTRPERQAAKYRTERNALRTTLAEVQAELKAIRDKDKKPEELTSEELKSAQKKADRLAEESRTIKLENAFLRANVVDWVDPEDALRLVDLDEVDIDEDGTVDRKALRSALRDLAKRKPHLVKKPKVSDPADDEDDDDDEPRSRRSARTVNGKRKGDRGKVDRASLAKDFPVLGKR